MSGRRNVTVIALALLLAISRPGSADVRAADYDAYWLWGGVISRPILARAKTLYILQGEVRANHRQGTVDIVAQGINTPRLKGNDIWLVYRANTLDWPARASTVINAAVSRWRLAGNRIVGVQVDFDAATRHLDDYAAFLQELRRQLTPDCRLGITGLLDWGNGIDPATVDQLRGVLDEVVIQTYQGRQTIPGYEAYLGQLDRLHLPFKIGLVEAGDWSAPVSLAANPWFRGYVVFLVNHP